MLPTDTQKNTVYAFAREHGVGQVEEFGLRLARHFVASQPAIHGAVVTVDEHHWDRLGRRTRSARRRRDAHHDRDARPATGERSAPD